MSGEGLGQYPAVHHAGTDVQPRSEAVVTECPVALSYNSEVFAVMMATPLDLPDFAVGFALAEGIVGGADELRLVDIQRSAQGVVLHCAIPQARFDALGERHRNLEGRSGCGLCGSDSLQAVLRPLPPVTTTVRWSPRALLQALARMQALQPLSKASGGAHAAALLCGESLLVREDVGRHNAVDKAIGAAVDAGIALPDCALLVTSRASFEIVQKAAAVGIGTVAAISAPTSLAVDCARTLGLALAAFARGDALNLYTGTLAD